MKLKQICIILPALFMLTCCGAPAGDTVTSPQQCVTAGTEESVNSGDLSSDTQDGDFQDGDGAGTESGSGTETGSGTDDQDQSGISGNEDNNSDANPDGEGSGDETNPDGEDSDVETVIDDFGPDLDGNTGNGSSNDDDEGCIGDEGLVW